MGLKPDLHAYREFARAYRQAVAAGAVPRGQPVAPNQISATITAAEALGITHATAKYRLSQAAHCPKSSWDSSRESLFHERQNLQRRQLHPVLMLGH